MFLRRAAIAASLLLLAVPAAATASPVAAADDPGTDGVIIQGSKLVTLVGGQDAPGIISVRFADAGIPLFYESDDGVSADAPGEFVIHNQGDAYSYDDGNYTQTSAPALTGAGSVANPWVVSSGFTTGDLGIVQQVRHVDGSRALRLTWTVTNTSASPQDFSAFWNADLYVSGSDEGTGDLLAGPPRTLEGIAIDSTTVGLVELTPWSHYYEGDWSTATDPTGNDSAVYDDSFDPTSLDNGFGVEWDVTALAPGASKTFVLGFSAAEPGGNPAPSVPPVLTQTPPNSTAATDATYGFEAAGGDTATVSFECSIDGGQYDPCTSPADFSGLAPGAHTFRVHGLNIDGDPGPSAAHSWTITSPPPPPSHRRATVRVPAVSVLRGHHLSLGCALSTGQVAECSVTLIGPKGVVLGRGRGTFHGLATRRLVHVPVSLTRAASGLASRLGGVRVTVNVSVLPVLSGEPLIARGHTRLVSPAVDVTPDALQFASGSSVLLPAARSYLLALAPQLAGAKRATAVGYTDDVGGAAANYQLGLARALTVCSIIEQRAHVSCRAISFGEGHPRATNTTAAGRALNRRVELRLAY